MGKLYRLSYKDRSHGAYESNFDSIKDSALFFNADIEVYDFERGNRFSYIETILWHTLLDN